MSGEDEKVVRLAECIVRLEEARLEAKALADEVWLSIYGPS